MIKNKKDQEWEKILQKAEDPKNLGRGSQSLPLNATALQKAKYGLCRKMLAYQMENRLSDQAIIKKTNLSQSELEDILNYRIDKVNSEILIEEISKLFAPCEIEIVIKENKDIHARIV